MQIHAAEEIGELRLRVNDLLTSLGQFEVVQSAGRTCSFHFELDELNLVATLIGGIHHWAASVGGGAGHRHQRDQARGVWQETAENITLIQDLLQDLMTRGLSPDRRYLFVVDGSKALYDDIGGVRQARRGAANRFTGGGT